MTSTSSSSLRPIPSGRLGASDVIRRIRSVRFTKWTLGFRQFSFHLTIRVSTGPQLGGFAVPCLSGHAVFPSSFRLQVNRMTQEHPSGLLLTESGIQHRVPRRTLSTHPAQASDNAPAWHDRARFHRPTTPLTERGLPIGLGVDRDGTSTEPATEDRRGPHHGRCRPRQICFAPQPVGYRFPSADTRGKSARFRAG